MEQKYCSIKKRKYQHLSISERIKLEAFLPLCIYFVYGLEEVFRNRRRARMYALFLACCLIPVLSVRMSSELEFKQDQDYFK